MSTYYLDDFEIGHSIFLNEDLTSYGVIDTNVTGLNNVGANEFWPASSGSAVVEAGYNVGSPYDTLLLETSDFTASPPLVYTEQFGDDYIGAYGIVGESVPDLPIQGAAGNFKYN